MMPVEWDENGVLNRENLKWDEHAEGWSFNVHRMIHSYGYGGDAVYQIWAGSTITHIKPPPEDRRHWSGSRDTSACYRTKELAWAALSREFEQWVDEKRGVIARMGERPPEPPVAKKVKKKGAPR